MFCLEMRQTGLRQTNRCTRYASPDSW
uniref:Uncharacterized protein n=1 Tax=Anguilla anguilla TaxID=7936 RepID=A0A0E9W0D1_ANGAN